MFLYFTVRDFVAWGRAPPRSLRGPLAPDSAQDDAAVISALNSLEISDKLASRPISKVSGGERQRTLVARALAQEAAILLLDEPTASLDLKATHSILETLRQLAHEHCKAVMVVLHDLNAAAEYADTVAVLAEGSLVKYGTPGEVMSAELIEQVYGVKVQVGVNPITGRPNVIVVP
jgi:ABC-type cobalamin/Fe3+-siderophores transport system ATPase subunit